MDPKLNKSMGPLAPLVFAIFFYIRPQLLSGCTFSLPLRVYGLPTVGPATAPGPEGWGAGLRRCFASSFVGWQAYCIHTGVAKARC